MKFWVLVERNTTCLGINYYLFELVFLCCGKIANVN